MFTVMCIIQLVKMLGHMYLFLLSDTCHSLELRVRTVTGQRKLPFPCPTKLTPEFLFMSFWKV